MTCLEHEWSIGQENLHYRHDNIEMQERQFSCDLAAWPCSGRLNFDLLSLPLPLLSIMNSYPKDQRLWFRVKLPVNCCLCVTANVKVSADSSQTFYMLTLKLASLSSLCPNGRIQTMCLQCCRALPRHLRKSSTSCYDMAPRRRPSTWMVFLHYMWRPETVLTGRVQHSPVLPHHRWCLFNLIDKSFAHN